MNSNNNRNYLNKRERIIGFIYVFILFSIITAAGCWLLLSGNKDIKLWNQKDIAIRKMESQKDFQQCQADVASSCDTLYARILRFSPGVHASYEENDIRFVVNDLKTSYLNHKWDVRYKVFEQVSDFYDIWLTDKKELWSRMQNVTLFKTNLEACEIGLQKKNEALKTK